MVEVGAAYPRALLVGLEPSELEARANSAQFLPVAPHTTSDVQQSFRGSGNEVDQFCSCRVVLHEEAPAAGIVGYRHLN